MSKKPSRLPTKITYTNIPQYTVNIDKPARERWNHIAIEYKDKFKKAFDILEVFLAELVPHPIFVSFARYFCAMLIYLRLFPHANEMIGIAKATCLSPGDLGIMHISYEITSFCTSILINDKSIFGTAINLRTMDWSMPFDLREYTAKVHFTNNKNEKLYDAVMFIGAVGVVTACKSDKYSIVVNFRNSSYNDIDGSTWITLKTILGFIYNFLMIFIGGWTCTSLIRYICENADCYADAVRLAKTSYLISPTYITVTGNNMNEGVVITRDRLKCLNENKLNTNPVVQCNSDWWTINKLNEFSDIYESKERHEMADHCLPKLFNNKHKKMEKKNLTVIDDEYKNYSFTYKQLEFITKCWRFLSQYPICNEETVYGNIIIPKYNLILTGNTTNAFEPVSASEFKEMFYMSSSNLDQIKK